MSLAGFSPPVSATAFHLIVSIVLNRKCGLSCARSAVSSSTFSCCLRSASCTDRKSFCKNASTTLFRM